MLKKSKQLMATCAWLTCIGPALAQGAQAVDACASQFNGQRIQIVVPHSQGGGYDLYARLLAPALQEATGARVSVSNMPAAEGLAGRQAILRDRSNPGHLVLGVSSLSPLIEREHLYKEDDVRMSDFSIVGLLSYGTVGWVVRKGTNIHAQKNTLLVSGVSSPITRVILPAIALGLNTKTLTSLFASSESYLALLRGDVDIFVAAESLYPRGMIDPDKVDTLFFLSRPQDHNLKHAPALTGDGGYLSRVTNNLPPAEKKRRQSAAALAQGLGSVHYAVLMAKNTPESIRKCMAGVVERISFDEAFMAQANRQRLEPRPMRVADVEIWLQELQKLIANNRDILAEAMRLSE